MYILSDFTLGARRVSATKDGFREYLRNYTLSTKSYLCLFVLCTNFLIDF